MALQGSGTIKFSEIQTEHGGSNPISLSEYYRGAGVDSTETVDATLIATASSYSGSVQNVRGAGYNSNPAINPSSSQIYSHVAWADNGGVNSGDVQFTVNKTGTYTVNVGGHYSNGGLTKTHTVFVEGVQQATLTTTFTGGSQNISQGLSVDCTAGDLMRITCTWNSGGWASSSVSVSNQVASTTTSNINTGLPTSGTVAMSDYYSTKNV